MIRSLLIAVILTPVLCFSNPLFLRQNFAHAQKGDYLVAVRNKNYTMILIEEKLGSSLVIQEITIPEPLFPRQCPTWRSWLEAGAPGHTAWVAYTVQLNTGRLDNYYSYSHQSWMKLSENDNLFSKLINLPFQPLPAHKRRLVGTSGGRERPWQPRMIVEGVQMPGILFDAWEGRWPRDQTELSGKKIIVYVPQPGEQYPDYFPYWMQVKGAVGKTQLRVVDSGRRLHSPRQYPLKRVSES